MTLPCESASSQSTSSKSSQHSTSAAPHMSARALPGLFQRLKQADATSIIAPSLLAADFTALGDAIAAVQAQDMQLLHLDIMDGHFVPNISFGANVVEVCRNTSDMLLDVHLMIAQPERYIDMFVAAGAHHITVHVETCTHLHRVLTQIREAGIGAGIALNPLTPLAVVQEALPYVDMVLIMSVNPGFGGQRYIDTTNARLAQVKAWIDAKNMPCVLEVDGGINCDTIAQAVHAGADICVAGSAIFKPQPSALAVQEKSMQDQNSVQNIIATNVQALARAMPH